MTVKIQSSHIDVIRHRDIGLWTVFTSRYYNVLLHQCDRIGFIEGTKRQFDDLGVLHCPGTDSFVGLVLAEKFRQLNIYLFC